DGAAAELGRHAGEAFVGVVARKSDGDDRRADDLWIMSGEVPKRFLEDRAVVYLRAEDDLSVELDVVIKQCLELFRDIRTALGDAEEIGAGLQIRRVNRYVLRREALFNDAVHLVGSDGRKRRVV